MTRSHIPVGWEAEFTIEIINDLFSLVDLEQVTTAAGMYAGLMDQRPSAPKKPGPYGRFEIAKFETVS